MKQLSFIPEDPRREHGGKLLLGRRRKRRPLSVKNPIHLVLKSDFATGSRNLLRHRPLIERIILKSAKRFRISVYEKAVVSNHIHLLVRGKKRDELQNFFRVVAGHIAQEILESFPILSCEKPKAGGAPGDSTNTTKQLNSRGRRGSGNDNDKREGGQRVVRARTRKRSKPLPVREKENKFWQTRIYSKLITWGRQFVGVKKYIVQNTLEALRIIPYQPRKKNIYLHNKFRSSS